MQRTRHNTNVQLMLQTVRHQIEHLLQPYLFSLNDHQTRQMVAQTVDNYMRSLNSSGVNDWHVVCDASNNTPRDIYNGMLNLDVRLQPVGQVSYINLHASLGEETFRYDYKTYL